MSWARPGLGMEDGSLVSHPWVLSAPAPSGGGWLGQTRPLASWACEDRSPTPGVTAPGPLLSHHPVGQGPGRVLRGGCPPPPLFTKGRGRGSHRAAQGRSLWEKLPGPSGTAEEAGGRAPALVTTPKPARRALSTTPIPNLLPNLFSSSRPVSPAPASGPRESLVCSGQAGLPPPGESGSLRPPGVGGRGSAE